MKILKNITLVLAAGILLQSGFSYADAKKELLAMIENPNSEQVVSILNSKDGKKLSKQTLNDVYNAYRNKLLSVGHPTHFSLEEASKIKNYNEIVDALEARINTRK